MPTATEPTREQVFRWLEENPSRTHGDCVMALWKPQPATDRSRKRAVQRIRTWVHRRKHGTPGEQRRRAASGGPYLVGTEPKPIVVADLPGGPKSEHGRVEFFVAQLNVLLHASRSAAERQDWRTVGVLNAQIAAARGDLDDAREGERSKGVRLGRTVPDVVGELDRQRKAIDILVGAAGVKEAEQAEGE